MIYINKQKDELIVNCDCGCGAGLLWQAAKWDDEGEQFYISLIEYSWYAKQTGKIRPYFKRLWRVLRGKEYYLTEIVLSKSEAKEFESFLHCLIEKSTNEGEIS